MIKSLTQCISGVITQNIRINTNIESDHNASHVLITFSLIVSLCFFNSFSISQKVLVLLQKCDFIIYQPNKIQYIYSFKRNKIQPKARY